MAAVLLRDQGYDVVGVFMRLGSPGEKLDELVPAHGPDGGACEARPGGRTGVKLGHQGCCSVSDAADARAVAAELGIPFYVANFRKDFGRIMDYFVAEYAQGRTPNPCVRCNDWLKFGKLHEYAKQIDADFVASGHYAQVKPVGSGEEVGLYRGVDLDKDQSYVLFGVPRATLGRMLLPIGGLRKSVVRQIAQERGLPVFNKPDSQEICFVPDNDYAGFIERRQPGLSVEGDVLDTEGKAVGRHGGQHRFTLGQRKGVGIALGYPIYVIGKDPGANTVTIGPKEALETDRCVVTEANWLVERPEAAAWLPVLAKFRSKSDPVAAKVRTIDVDDPRIAPETPNHSGRVGAFEVEFENPQSAVTPGQALVVYDAASQRVLSGGWVARTVVGEAAAINPAGATGQVAATGENSATGAPLAGAWKAL